MKRVNFIASLGIFFLGVLPASAQVAPRYLAAATIDLSVDDWGSIWLNGHPIVDQLPYTMEGAEPHEFKCLPEHLCFFQKENVLAIEVANAVKNAPPSEDHAGIAYLLRMRFTDGTETVLSSGERDQNLSDYISDRYAGEPQGWHYYNFNDSGWAAALGNGGSVPYAAILTNPESRVKIPAISALSTQLTAQYPGERHLFRRKFSLQIDSNPNCFPTPVSPAVRSNPSGVIPAFRPVPSPLVLPVLVQASPTLVPPAAVKAVLGKPRLTHRRMPRSTPTLPWLFVPRTTAVPFEKNAPGLIPEPEATAPVTIPTLAPLTAASASTSIFEETPANIYLTYADGPGLYRLIVLDAGGLQVREIFNKKVVAQEGEWVEWDGRGDLGRSLPDGIYSIVFYKDDKILKEIPIRKKDSS